MSPPQASGADLRASQLEQRLTPAKTISTPTQPRALDSATPTPPLPARSELAPKTAESAPRPSGRTQVQATPGSLPSQNTAAMPELHLQAIHYRLGKPSVVINNKTLFVGSEINGAKIASIGRQSVQLVIRGQTLVLEKR
jgi:hypothetical protein